MTDEKYVPLRWEDDPNDLNDTRPMMTREQVNAWYAKCEAAGAECTDCQIDQKSGRPLHFSSILIPFKNSSRCLFERLFHALLNPLSSHSMI